MPTVSIFYFRRQNRFYFYEGDRLSPTFPSHKIDFLFFGLEEAIRTDKRATAN